MALVVRICFSSMGIDQVRLGKMLGRTEVHQKTIENKPTLAAPYTIKTLVALTKGLTKAYYRFSSPCLYSLCVAMLYISGLLRALNAMYSIQHPDHRPSLIRTPCKQLPSQHYAQVSSEVLSSALSIQSHSSAVKTLQKNSCTPAYPHRPKFISGTRIFLGSAAPLHVPPLWSLTQLDPGVLSFQQRTHSPA